MQDMQATPDENSGEGQAASPVTEQEHQTLIQWFEDAEWLRRDARIDSHKCRDYYDSKQFTSEQRKTIEKRGEPVVVFNRVAPKVNLLLGLEAQQRTDPKARPRTPNDEDAAEAATDALRYVEERENLDSLFSLAYEDMLIEGECAIEVGIKEVNDPKSETGRRAEVDIKCWRFDRIFADAHSSKHDYSDARYVGGITWMDRSQAEHKWKDKVDLIQSSFVSTSLGTDDGYKDKPAWQWTNTQGKRDRIAVVQMYWLEGEKWRWAIFTRGGVLEGGDVPYVNSDGETECPLLLQACYIDRENNRYGMVKALIDPQNEINKRRSKLLHHVSVRQLLYEKGAVNDIGKAAREFAKPGGLIEVNPGGMDRIQVLQMNDMASGQAQLLQHSQSEMDEMGANNALRGATGSQSSGRAIIASQQGGQLEIGPIQDRHRDLKLRVQRAIWNRIRQYWDGPRWINVTDNEQNVKFSQLNEPQTLAQMIEGELKERLQEMKEQGADPNEIRAFAEQSLQKIQATHTPEELNQVVERKNDLARMDMDILLDTAPDSTIIQQEQFEELTKIMGSGLEITDPRLRLMIMSSQIRGKKDILKYIDDQQKKPSPEQEKAGQLELKTAEAELAETQAKTQKTTAETQRIQAETSSTSVSTEIAKDEAVQRRMMPQEQPQIPYQQF